MGYTHYWYRKDRTIEPETFKGIASDFQKLVPTLKKLGIELADGDGRGSAVITADLISFNGLQHCGHPKGHELGIAWPSKQAGGVANPWREDVRSEDWFAGAMIDKRTCSGDCSHETCHFPRVVPEEHTFSYHPTDEKGRGWHFDFCKTAYKPYDVAVTALLVIAKRHLKERVWICSDGETQHWADARVLCEQVLGYGAEFELDR